VIEVIGRAVVPQSPEEVLRFVCDLERYRFADTKIGKIIRQPVLSADGTGTARYRGRVRPPIPADTNDVRLRRWTRIDFVGSSGSWRRKVLDFHGWFTCEETDAGTVVEHGEHVDFHRPGSWLIEPFLRKWLAADMDKEMTRPARLVGATGAAASEPERT
jgi:Polyketide cyclase / dehydrase and lipid transport